MRAGFMAAALKYFHSALTHDSNSKDEELTDPDIPPEGTWFGTKLKTGPGRCNNFTDDVKHHSKYSPKRSKTSRVNTTQLKCLTEILWRKREAIQLATYMLIQSPHLTQQ